MPKTPVRKKAMSLQSLLYWSRPEEHPGHLSAFQEQAERAWYSKNFLILQPGSGSMKAVEGKEIVQCKRLNSSSTAAICVPQANH